MARRRRKTPQFYYNQQKQSAKARGIPWEFTFETWWKVWEESGHWHERGRNSGQFGMARNGDTGPYHPDNVKIKVVNENNKDGMLKWREEQRKELAIQTNTSYDVGVQTIQKPIEEPKIKIPTIPKTPIKKENPWSWRNLLVEAFPLLKWLLPTTGDDRPLKRG